MNVIGIYGAIGWESHNDNGWVHDAGATLFVDGKHSCSIQEERLTGYKYDGDFPENSIKYVLGDLTEEDIDVVVVPCIGQQIFMLEWLQGHTEHYLKHIFPNAKIRFVSHHKAHAWSSIYSCNAKEGCYLVIDGGGSYSATKKGPQFIEECSFGYFNKEKNLLRHFNVGGQYGLFHQYWSHNIWCEKTNNQDIRLTDHRYVETFSGKVMGLAAYGKNNDPKNYEFSTIGMPIVDFMYHDAKDLQGMSPENKAAFLQNNIENALVDFIGILDEKGYLDKDVCLSGGIFLNIPANTKIVKKFPHLNFHLTPFVNDCGLHYGAAASVGVEVPENLALLGKSYDEKESNFLLLDNWPKYRKYIDYEIYYNDPDGLCKKVSEYLNDNKIIGWYQGRSEFGPRALGSRSILMSPKYKENKDILNSRVKHREYWRPFAGVILEDRLQEYFEEDIVSPYMLYSQTVKQEKKDRIPAIVHEDGTCRIQTIKEGKLSTLLKEYDKLSGDPVLLNTSFNDNGKPIIETPEDALEGLINMNIDYLVIGNTIVKKT